MSTLTDAVLESKYCSPLVEFATVRCRPFYTPHKFTAVFILSVYIPLSANARDALTELYSAWSVHTQTSEMHSETHPSLTFKYF